MTQEELKEMVDSTINTNGEKAITGKALNLALNAIIESMSTGSSARRLYANIGDTTLTEEELASNALLYTDIVAAYEAKQAVPEIYVYFSAGDLDAVCYYIKSLMVVIQEGNIFLVFWIDGAISTALLQSDGSVLVESSSSLSLLSHE